MINGLQSNSICCISAGSATRIGPAPILLSCLLISYAIYASCKYYSGGSFYLEGAITLIDGILSNLMPLYFFVSLPALYEGQCTGFVFVEVDNIEIQCF